MWYRKPFLVLAPPHILFINNKKSLAKINLQRIYIFIIRQYFLISCINRKNFDLLMYIFLIHDDMGVPFQARSRYFSRLAVLKLSWGNVFIHFYRHGISPYRHARAILMCLLRVYVMPSILCIHCTFLLWHCLKFWRIDWNRTADDSTLRKPLLSLGA